MSSALVLSGSLLAGAVLALWMFGGLWMTVRRLPSIERPTPMVLISLGLRLGGTVLGFTLLALVSWQAVLFGLAGFLMVRTVLIRAMNRSEPKTGSAPETEGTPS